MELRFIGRKIMRANYREKIIHKIQRFNVFDTCKCVPKSFFDFHNATPISRLKPLRMISTSSAILNLLKRRKNEKRTRA